MIGVLAEQLEKGETSEEAVVMVYIGSEQPHLEYLGGCRNLGYRVKPFSEMAVPSGQRSLP